MLKRTTVGGAVCAVISSADTLTIVSLQQQDGPSGGVRIIRAADSIIDFAILDSGAIIVLTGDLLSIYNYNAIDIIAEGSIEAIGSRCDCEGTIFEFERLSDVEGGLVTATDHSISLPPRLYDSMSLSHCPCISTSLGDSGKGESLSALVGIGEELYFLKDSSASQLTVVRLSAGTGKSMQLLQGAKYVHVASGSNGIAVVLAMRNIVTGAIAIRYCTVTGDAVGPTLVVQWQHCCLSSCVPWAFCGTLIVFADGRSLCLCDSHGLRTSLPINAERPLNSLHLVECVTEGHTVTARLLGTSPDPLRASVINLTLSSSSASWEVLHHSEQVLPMSPVFSYALPMGLFVPVSAGSAVIVSESGLVMVAVAHPRYGVQLVANDEYSSQFDQSSIAPVVRRQLNRLLQVSSAAVVGDELLTASYCPQAELTVIHSHQRSVAVTTEAIFGLDLSSLSPRSAVASFAVMSSQKKTSRVVARVKGAGFGGSFQQEVELVKCYYVVYSGGGSSGSVLAGPLTADGRAVKHPELSIIDSEATLGCFSVKCDSTTLTVQVTPTQLCVVCVDGSPLANQSTHRLQDVLGAKYKLKPMRLAVSCENALYLSDCRWVFAVQFSMSARAVKTPTATPYKLQLLASYSCSTELTISSLTAFPAQSPLMGFKMDETVVGVSYWESSRLDLMRCNASKGAMEVAQCLDCSGMGVVRFCVVGGSDSSWMCVFSRDGQCIVFRYLSKSYYPFQRMETGLLLEEVKAVDGASDGSGLSLVLIADSRPYLWQLSRMDLNSHTCTIGCFPCDLGVYSGLVQSAIGNLSFLGDRLLVWCRTGEGRGQQDRIEIGRLSLSVSYHMQHTAVVKGYLHGCRWHPLAAKRVAPWNSTRAARCLIAATRAVATVFDMDLRKICQLQSQSQLYGSTLHCLQDAAQEFVALSLLVTKEGPQSTQLLLETQLFSSGHPASGLRCSLELKSVVQLEELVCCELCYLGEGWGALQVANCGQVYIIGWRRQSSGAGITAEPLLKGVIGSDVIAMSHTAVPEVADCHLLGLVTTGGCIALHVVSHYFDPITAEPQLSTDKALTIPVDDYEEVKLFSLSAAADNSIAVVFLVRSTVVCHSVAVKVSKSTATIATAVLSCSNEFKLSERFAVLVRGLRFNPVDKCVDATLESGEVIRIGIPSAQTI